MAPLAPRTGDAAFANVECVNAELFTLTYGAIVRQLLTDLEEVEEVNKQLDQMGYNIGVRLIDEFLAKSGVSRCVDFRETVDVIARVGFKKFLEVTASVTNWDAEGTSCSLVLDDNPLVGFVKLPGFGICYMGMMHAYELRVKLLKQVRLETTSPPAKPAWKGGKRRVWSLYWKLRVRMQKQVERGKAKKQLFSFHCDPFSYALNFNDGGSTFLC